MKTLSTLGRLAALLVPVAPGETPRWLYRAGRLSIDVCVVLLPLLYDGRVPDSASDPRWMLVQLDPG